MKYTANTNRYDRSQYRRTGQSGLLLPEISLGLWHNFGASADHCTMRVLCQTAFDHGITHFDLANNYGPPPGTAEANFGQILANELSPYRDEIIISTKAGYGMWPGPYGDWGSRKYLIASAEQSLKRLGVSYVDVFYSHRFDPNTPLEETMGALDTLVRQGKALYAGISNYSAQETKRAARILKDLGTPCLINQANYSIFNRSIEHDDLLTTTASEGMGVAVYSPLAQGLLTNRYLHDIPGDSRASHSEFLTKESITAQRVEQIERLNSVAEARNQTLAQMALSWVLREKRVTSAVIGASKPEQIIDCLKASTASPFTSEELNAINLISSA